MELYFDWTDFKNLINKKKIPIQYVELGNFYKIFMQEGVVVYKTDIEITSPASTNQNDFENNYKTDANKELNPKDEYGKEFVRAESRPIDMTTYFTMQGDDINNSLIGGGTDLKWDFSNSTNDVTAPTNFKRKRIEFRFIDGIRVKEGTIYWKDKLFGSYIDLFVICPSGQYYLDNTGTPQLADEDTIIDHFVNHHFIMDTCIMGDELNTEAASLEIPSAYKFRLEITVPDSDNISKGYVSIEIYRRRTVVL
jgi:hypothetical protein